MNLELTFVVENVEVHIFSPRYREVLGYKHFGEQISLTLEKDPYLIRNNGMIMMT